MSPSESPSIVARSSGDLSLRRWTETLNLSRGRLRSQATKVLIAASKYPFSSQSESNEGESAGISTNSQRLGNADSSHHLSTKSDN